VSFLVNSQTGYDRVVIGQLCCVECIFPSLGVPESTGRCLFRRWLIGVVMTAAKLVLEPIFEAGFLPVSFGFRPKRSAHDGLVVVRVEANRGREWVLDADVSDCLDASSHCSSR